MKYVSLCLSVVVLWSSVQLLAHYAAPAQLLQAVFAGNYYTGGGSGRVLSLSVSRPIDAIRSRAEAAGIEVLAVNSNTFSEVEAAVRQADVTIVSGATISGEATDRASLDLDGEANSLIGEVAQAAKRTVVIMQVPGAVVLPWSSSVQAIAMMFLGGQATGAAWADVLFGDRAPTGRLPLSIPLTEEDQIQPEALEVKYSEGLETGYRSTKLKFAYPFGHGLGYTAFSYSEPASARCASQFCPAGCDGAAQCISINVTNIGQREGAAVPQMYLEFPPAAGQPSAILKGFFNTGLLRPGEMALATFPLSVRDFSYYANGTWVPAESGVAHIRESYTDERANISLAFA